MIAHDRSCLLGLILSVHMTAGVNGLVLKNRDP